MAAKKAAGRGFPDRKPTTSFYDVQTADDEVLEAALAEAAKVTAASVLLKYSTNEEMRRLETAAQESVDARVAACFERLHFREIDPEVRDELLTAHPYPDEAPNGYHWPYVHHLAAASCVELQKTPEEWADFTSGFNVGNWGEFFNAVLSAQRKTAKGDIPKG